MHSFILTSAGQMIHSVITVNHSNDSRHDLTDSLVNLTFAFVIPETEYVDVWSS